jgi:hypothetical protein
MALPGLAKLPSWLEPLILIRVAVGPIECFHLHDIGKSQAKNRGLATSFLEDGSNCLLEAFSPAFEGFPTTVVSFADRAETSALVMTPTLNH